MLTWQHLNPHLFSWLLTELALSLKSRRISGLSADTDVGSQKQKYTHYKLHNKLNLHTRVLIINTVLSSMNLLTGTETHTEPWWYREVVSPHPQL